MNWLTNIVQGIRADDNVIRVLAVMAKDSDRQVLSQIGEKAKWHIEFASNYESAVELAGRRKFAVILCDRDLSSAFNWREAVQKLAGIAPGSCVMLTSPVNDDVLWQEVIDRGGYDVLTKPFHEERVVRSVRFACSSWNKSI